MYAIRSYYAASPGSTRFTKQVSMPAEPVPDMGNVSRFSVRMIFRNMPLMPSMISMKKGSR